MPSGGCGSWEWASNAPECLCPRVRGRVYHDKATCSDVRAIRLGLFGTPPIVNATGGPRPAHAGRLL